MRIVLLISFLQYGDAKSVYGVVKGDGLVDDAAPRMLLSIDSVETCAEA